MPLGTLSTAENQNLNVWVAMVVWCVKFDKASSGALAMESLNSAVLNHGRAPKVKVLLADSLNAR